MYRSPWKLAVGAAVVGLLATAVLVPVLTSSTSSSSSPSASSHAAKHPTSPVTKSSSVPARTTAKLSAAPTLAETFVSSLDAAHCATPPGTGRQLAVPQGAEVCYRIAVNIPPAADISAAVLTLSFVDAKGNPSAEEQFRTGMVTRGAITTHEVPAPLSVVGFANRGTATLGAGADPVAVVAPGLGTPQVTDVSSVLGAQFLTLTLGDALGSASSSSYRGPHYVEVAAIPTGVALQGGQTSGSPVYLSARLAYGGSAVAPVACAATSCEAQVIPQAPALQVTKTYSGKGPYDVAVAVSSDSGGKAQAHDVTACEPAASGTAVLNGARHLATCGASSTAIASALAPGAAAPALHYVFTPPAGCRPTIQDSFCDQVKVASQTPATVLGTDTQVLPPTAALVRSTSGSSVREASALVTPPATLSETVVPTIAAGDPPFNPSTGKFVAEGETVVYSFTMTNTGTTDFSDATVVDTLPAGLTVATLPTDATQAPGTGGSTVVTFVLGGPLAAGGPSAPGSEVTFSYTATVDASIPSPDPIPADNAAAGWTITPTGGPPVVTSPATSGVMSSGLQLDVTQASASVAVTVDSATTFDADCKPETSGDILEGDELCYKVTVSPGALASARVVLEFVNGTDQPSEDVRFRTCGTGFTCVGGAPTGDAQPLSIGTGFANRTASTSGAHLGTDDSLTLDLGAVSSTNPADDVIEVAAIAPGVGTPGAVQLQATLTLADGTGTAVTGDSPLVTPVAPDVTVTKTVTSSGVADPTTAEIGDSLSYTVIIANSAATTFDAHEVGYCDDLSMSSKDVTLSDFSSVITPPGGGPTTPGQSSGGSLPLCTGSPPLDPSVTLAPGATETVKYTIKFNTTPECGGVAAVFPDYCNKASATYQIPPTIVPTATSGPTLVPTVSGSSTLDVVGGPAFTVSMADASANPPPSPIGSTYATIGQEFDFTLNVAVPEGGLDNLSITAVLPTEMGLVTDSGGALLGSDITAEPSGSGLCATLPATPCDAGGEATVSSSTTGATGNEVVFAFPTVAHPGTSGAAGNLQITFPSYVLNTAANQSFSAATPPSGTPTFSLTYASPDSPTPTRAGSAVAPATLSFVDEALAVNQVATNAVQDVNEHLVFTDTFTNSGRSPAYATAVCTGIPSSTIDVTTLTVVSGPGSVNMAPTAACPSSQVEVSPGAISGAKVTGSTITPTVVTVVWSVVDTATPPQSDLPVPASFQSFSLANDPTVPPNPGSPLLFTRWNPTGDAGTSVVGLTAPAIGATSSSPGLPPIVLPDVQIGERLTYNVVFTVPVTGTDATQFVITLNPGLAFATGAGGAAVCTTGSGIVSKGCVAALGLTNDQSAVTLPKPTQTAGSSVAPTLDVSLGDLRYPTPSTCPGGSPTPVDPCAATATVTLSYDVYVVDSNAAATSSPAISVPVTSRVSYLTVPDGEASTPLSSSATDLAIVNPLVGEPAVTTSPPTTVQAEVGQDSPGPALVNFTVTVSPPTAGTAYDTTATVTVPSGLWIVNGAPESATIGGAGPPVCLNGVTCTLGTALTQATGAVAALPAASAAAPTTCRSANDPPAPAGTADPAIDGRTVVVQVPVLSQPVTLTFYACVDSTTQLFGTSTPANSHATTTLAWYTVPPAAANWVPLSGGGVATEVGAPSPHLFNDGSGQTTAIDFTGTSVSITGTPNTAANGGTGYAIGATVTYTATVTLPEASDNLSSQPPLVDTLPTFDVCVFLPSGLTLDPTIAPPVPGTELGNVQAPTIVSQGTLSTITTIPNAVPDPNCVPAAGTTLYDVQYPAGATINYDAQYQGDSFTQQFSVIVGPDPSTLARGNLETVQASAAVAGRSGTTVAAAPPFAILEPDLSLGVTLSPTSKWTPGSQVVANVTLSNALAGGFSSPAYGDSVRIILPMADVVNDIRPSAVVGAIGSATPQVLPAWGPGAVLTPDSSATIGGVAHDSVTFSEPTGSIAPGETDTLSISFTLGNLLLDQTQVPVIASLVDAYSFSGNAGRVYASPGSSVASTHQVPVATATIVITGPKAAIKATLAGPAGTVAPGSSPSWTVTLENVGPSALSAANGLRVVVTSTPTLIDPIITATNAAAPAYNQNTDVWPIALPVFSAANPATAVQLTITGQVPDTATGSITLSVQASPNAGVVDTDPKLGEATISEALQSEVSVSAAVTLSGELFAGQQATYTLSVANAGPSAAGNITMTDSLPQGTKFDNASGPGFVCNTALPLSCTYAGPMVAKKSAAVTLDITVGSATGTSVTNTESVSTANNTSTHTTSSLTDVVRAVAANSAQAQAQAQQAATAAQNAAATGSAVSAGTAASGSSSVASPAATSTTSGQLASTGAEVLQELTFGSLAVLLGFALVGSVRRRRVRSNKGGFSRVEAAAGPYGRTPSSAAGPPAGTPARATPRFGTARATLSTAVPGELVGETSVSPAAPSDAVAPETGTGTGFSESGSTDTAVADAVVMEVPVGVADATVVASPPPDSANPRRSLKVGLLLATAGAGVALWARRRGRPS